MDLSSHLVKGRCYTREQIHELYNGQRQGGISTPQSHPVVLLFVSHRGANHGYRDGWQDDGYYHYTGQGQYGNMTMIRGNAAIRNHRNLGKRLFVFETASGSGALRLCLGEFEYVAHYVEHRPDTDGHMRDAIVFRLEEVSASLSRKSRGGALSFVNARVAALRAASEVPLSDNVGTSVAGRNQVMGDYVLLRASGFCEGCGDPSPFIKTDGSYYLEAHSINRLLDDEFGHPSSVAALCPNCHRLAHHGASAEVLKRRLSEQTAALEAAVADRSYAYVTAAVLLDRNGAVWTGRRTSPSLNGKWEFPGGKVRQGEELMDTLRREIGEELSIKLGRLLPFTMVDHHYAGLYVRLFVYFSPPDSRSGSFVLRAHDLAAWAHPHDISFSSLAQADRKVLVRILRRFGISG